MTPEPLKLSALSLGDTLLRWQTNPKYVLIPSQQHFFQQEINRLEQDRFPGFGLSAHLQSSRENKFFYDVLSPLYGCTFSDLMGKYPDLFPNAIKRSKESLKAAAAEWETLTNLFTNIGTAIPRSSLEFEIREALGLYGKTAVERLLRTLKRRIQRKLKGLLYHLRKQPPSSNCV